MLLATDKVVVRDICQAVLPQECKSQNVHYIQFIDADIFSGKPWGLSSPKDEVITTSWNPDWWSAYRFKDKLFGHMVSSSNFSIITHYNKTIYPEFSPCHPGWKTLFAPFGTTNPILKSIWVICPSWSHQCIPVFFKARHPQNYNHNTSFSSPLISFNQPPSSTISSSRIL